MTDKITAERTKALVPERDIHGNSLEVGNRVRSFDFPMLMGDSAVWGLDLEGDRVCYAEGILEAIGEDTMEGCQRYRIKVERRVYSEKGRLVEKRPGKTDPAGAWTIFPPLNGVPVLGARHACFGVVRVL
mgnify:CR=1 FL=1